MDFFGFGDDDRPAPNRAQRRAAAKEARREAKAATKRYRARQAKEAEQAVQALLGQEIFPHQRAAVAAALDSQEAPR